MTLRAMVLRTALLILFCVAPVSAVPSSLGILSQNYAVSTYEFYEALVVDGSSSVTFGPTADPVINFGQSATPPVEIQYHALWPDQGSDVLLQAEANHLAGRVAAAGVVFSPPEWTSVRLTVQVEAGGQITFRPAEDLQVIWQWEYLQQEGSLPLSARWSLTDVTTGEERTISTGTSDPLVGQMTLNLLSTRQYSVDWFLVAGSVGFDDLVAFPGDPRTVDVLADLQMSLVVVPVPGAVLLAIIGAGLIGLRRRQTSAAAAGRR